MGSSFDCPSSDNEIVLLLNQNERSVPKECSSDDVKASAKIVLITNNVYLSELNVTVNSTFNDIQLMMNITCEMDNGISTVVVYSYQIKVKSCTDEDESDTTGSSGKGIVNTIQAMLAIVR